MALGGGQAIDRQPHAGEPLRRSVDHELEADGLVGGGEEIDDPLIGLPEVVAFGAGGAFGQADHVVDRPHVRRGRIGLAADQEHGRQARGQPEKTS